MAAPPTPAAAAVVQMTTTSPDEAGCKVISLDDFAAVASLKATLDRIKARKQDALLQALLKCKREMNFHEMRPSRSVKFALKRKTLSTIDALLFPFGMGMLKSLPHPHQAELKALADSTAPDGTQQKLIHDILRELTAQARTAANGTWTWASEIVFEGEIGLRRGYECIEKFYGLAPEKVASMTATLLKDGTFSQLLRVDIVELDAKVTHATATDWTVRLLACTNWHEEAVRRPGPLQNFPLWHTRPQFKAMAATLSARLALLLLLKSNTRTTLANLDPGCLLTTPLAKSKLKQQQQRRTNSSQQSGIHTRKRQRTLPFP